jgi:uncharacterized membrane protein (DUF106 family)
VLSFANNIEENVKGRILVVLPLFLASSLLHLQKQSYSKFKLYQFHFFLHISFRQFLNPIIIVLLCCLTLTAYSTDATFTQQDRERMIRLEERMIRLEERMEAMQKEINIRFEAVDKRFEAIDKRFEMLFMFLWIITGIFTVITSTAIGFAFYDRRTFTEKSIEKAFIKIETEGTSRKLLEALRQLAKEDEKIAAVLRQFNLL